MSKVKRGVRMTASAKRPPAAWREELLEETAKLQEEEQESSRIQWEAMEREVKVERDRMRLSADLAEGKRGVPAPEYDDVAGEAADESAEAARVKTEAEARAAEDALREEADLDSPPSSPEPSRGVITAGQGDREKKRGGQRRTGAERRKKKDDAGDEDGKKKKKRKRGEDDEEDDRWVKLRLKGDEKEKRIDATRIVYYHDFDTVAAEAAERAKAEEAVALAAAAKAAETAASASSSSQKEAAPQPAPSATAALRASLRNLWADDSEDEA
eukprot:TRINITY_DN57114_c0_g1_i1.p1 TRINITY_DN57114_c0_g1~~TRINITY_DN57114_c0_g1_i1.p1  ORF type:complete len:271 (-),score=93.20 TRINITY_DN57114_c0_g1_i1:142-954(-)